MPLLISLKVAAIATLIIAAVGIPTAYGMARYANRARNTIDALLLLPLVLPPTVIGFGLLWLLGDYGPFAKLNTRLPVSLPVSIVFTWWAAVLTAVVVAFPLMYRSSRAAFEQVEPALIDAARTLGASEWKVFRRIAVPLAAPGILSGTLLSFARALGEFGATLMVAGNIPGKTQTLPMAVYFAVEGGDWRTATIWSGITGAIALGVVLLANYVAQQPVKREQSAKRKEESLSHLKNNHLGFQPNETNEKEDLWPQKTSPQPTLQVDIVKRLRSFTLSVRFETTDGLIGVLGASGAGKSLLLRCLAGIEMPDAGKIVLGDRVLFDSERRIDIPSCDRKIALLFQNYALFPHLSAYENVAFGLSSAARHRPIQRAIQELAAVALQAFAQHYPHQLSGGQQQRVALARALATQPQLLLLDEPFSALDTHLRSHLAQQIFSRLRSYPGTTLLVSHHLHEAYRAQQLVVMLEGKVVRQAVPVEVFAEPQQIAIAQLTGPINESLIQQIGDCLVATRWQLSLQLSPAVLQKNDFANHQLSVGIRPHHVRFIAKAMYNSSQLSSYRAAKITDSSLANRSGNRAPDIRDSDIQDSDIQAPDIQALDDQVPDNRAPCWLANHWLQPDSVVLSIKLHSAATHISDYHLSVIVTPLNWHQLQQQPFPWTVYLPPEHLIALRP